MRTERIVLRLAKANGSARAVPMRYNASHQRGYRCFVGELADSPDLITEDTPRSFEGRSLFDALAEYRAQIEPDGWRLLHAAARRDCWAKPEGFTPWVYRLTPGVEETQQINAFEAAGFDEVASLAEQHASFDAWMKSLAPVHLGRVPPKAGHEHDRAEVQFGVLSLYAGLYLVQGHTDHERVLEIIRKRHEGPWWNPEAPKGS